MPKQNNATGPRICFVVVVASIMGLLCHPDQGWAKHNKSKTSSTSSDPCASPTAFVAGKISTIRTLRKALSAHTSAGSVSAWIFDLDSQKKTLDADKVAQISELRRDADSVNDMLRAGGCKAFDIDQELAKPEP